MSERNSSMMKSGANISGIDDRPRDHDGNIIQPKSWVWIDGDRMQIHKILKVDGVWQVEFEPNGALYDTDEVVVCLPAADPVHAPSHYAGDGVVDCKRAMESMMSGYGLAAIGPVVSYWCGCAFKYLWRWPLKNKKQDLEKARECLDQAIRSLEK